MHRTATLATEVTQVSRHGFWLLLNNEKLLAPFAASPRALAARS